MRGPILGQWGDQDTGAGMDNVEQLRAALQKAGVEHEFHIYPGLGHGFLKASLEDPKTPGYEQACASWKRTLELYRRCFARAPVAARAAGRPRGSDHPPSDRRSPRRIRPRTGRVAVLFDAE